MNNNALQKLGQYIGALQNTNTSSESFINLLKDAKSTIDLCTLNNENITPEYTKLLNQYKALYNNLCDQYFKQHTNEITSAIDHQFDDIQYSLNSQKNINLNTINNTIDNVKTNIAQLINLQRQKVTLFIDSQEINNNQTNIDHAVQYAKQLDQYQNQLASILMKVYGKRPHTQSSKSHADIKKQLKAIQSDTKVFSRQDAQKLFSPQQIDISLKTLLKNVQQIKQEEILSPQNEQHIDKITKEIEQQIAINQLKMQSLCSDQSPNHLNSQINQDDIEKQLEAIQSDTEVFSTQDAQKLFSPQQIDISLKTLLKNVEQIKQEGNLSSQNEQHIDKITKEIEQQIAINQLKMQSLCSDQSPNHLNSQIDQILGQSSHPNDIARNLLQPINQLKEISSREQLPKNDMYKIHETVLKTENYINDHKNDIDDNIFQILMNAIKDFLGMHKFQAREMQNNQQLTKQYHRSSI